MVSIGMKHFKLEELFQSHRKDAIVIIRESGIPELFRCEGFQNIQDVAP